MFIPPAQHAQPSHVPQLGEIFNLSNPVEAKLSALADAGNWDALCDQFEALPQEMALRFRGTWVEALGRARRWERLRQVCDRLLKSPAYLKDPKRPDFLRQRARALSQMQRHAEALAAWEEVGRGGGGCPRTDQRLPGGRDPAGLACPGAECPRALENTWPQARPRR